MWVKKSVKIRKNSVYALFLISAPILCNVYKNYLAKSRRQCQRPILNSFGFRRKFYFTKKKEQTKDFLRLQTKIGSVATHSCKFVAIQKHLKILAIITQILVKFYQTIKTR